MTHPELATEAMNRLAQALVCLTSTARPSQEKTRLPSRAVPPPLPVLTGPANGDGAVLPEPAESGRRLRGSPPGLGQAGRPAYLIAALARQENPVETYRERRGPQRAALLRDWHAGRKLLRAHHAFLLDELRVLRRLTPRQRFA